MMQHWPLSFPFNPHPSPMATALAASPEAMLADAVGEFYANPYGFVMFAWPWGEVGTELEHSAGPDENQTKFLKDLGEEVRKRRFDGHTPCDPILMSISSAVGTGKSTLGAWIAWWIMSTRVESMGKVTAGNYTQLESSTWAEIQTWGRRCITGHWFDILSSGIFHKDPRYSEKWGCIPQTAAPERASTFAGLHRRNSTPWVLIDEAGQVHDTIYEPCYGNLTDGEPMMFVWGQMLRNTGEFYDICFGEKANKWNSRVFDGWNSAFTNKKTLEEYRDEYGPDSDFYRVRVLGLPPRASELQFIGQQLVDDARKREHVALDDEPLVWGYDAANGGLARHAFWARRGLDAKSIPPIFLPGDTPRDVVVAKIVELMSDTRPGRRAAAMFGDQAFGAVVLERVRQSGYTNVFEVNFGDQSPDKHQYNMRAYMWARMKDWLALGALYDDSKIAQPFMDPGFSMRNGRLVLESKQDMAKRRVKSPDGPDALALTFARPVGPKINRIPAQRVIPSRTWG